MSHVHPATDEADPGRAAEAARGSATPSVRHSTPPVWRSLAEFEGSPEVAAFAKREFPSDDFDRLESPDRRRFMQILGASAALAGASSCRWEKEDIVPYPIRPEDRAPGQRVVYSTVMDLAGAARPVRVESFDGRPVKVEPNALTGGGTDIYSQAAILGFYDPDRSRRCLRGAAGARPAASSYDAAIAELVPRLAAGKGAVLASTSSSPTLHRLAEKLRAAGVRWTWYSPVDREQSIEGARIALGQPLRTVYDLARADVVLSLDSDFQRDHPDALRMASAFGSRRKPELGDLSRVYAVEARFTSSGLSSDHRLPLRASDVGAFVELVDAYVAGRAPAAGSHALTTRAKLDAFARAVAEDLKAAGARAAIVVGEGQPAAVHARVHALHAALGAVGTTVSYLPEPLAEAGSGALTELVAAMNDGLVDTLVILEGNPVYDAPSDLAFGAALERVASVAHLSLYVDETSAAVLARGGWHLNAAHWLEAWGDARSYDGTLHLAQPLIAPLYGGKSSIELAAALASEEAGGEAAVRATFASLGLTGAPEARWRRALHDGFAEGSAFAPVAAAVTGAATDAIPSGGATLELNLFPCAKVFDGRFANNGWLQELPDTVTKLTWDNALLIGVATAKRLGLSTGDKVRVRAQDVELEAAAYVMAGHAEESASMALGYGRTSAGVIAGFDEQAIASVGFDAYKLRRSQASSIVTGVTIEKNLGSHTFASTQEHHLIDAIGMSGRAERLPMLAREGSLEEYEADPGFAKHRVHLPPNMRSLFDTKVYDGEHQWGMTIDLAACNGCNACVIACQSENNVPIVGKEQVARGREMHWMRVDFYFQGDADEADTVDAVSQPVNCLQCENAPCEQVCPVAATVHSQDGLNDMVYNRCIGTRYCGNNCPAKVRRFNYFHYTKFMDKAENKVLQLAQNPDVTVRSRGVMEKCTYCVQRIAAGRIKARNQGRTIRDGEVATACESACPPNAITFGNIADHDSRVAKQRELPRAYAMLEELNIRPRTLYMAKVNNFHPTLAKSMQQGAWAAGTIPAGHAGGAHGNPEHTHPVEHEPAREGAGH